HKRKISLLSVITSIMAQLLGRTNVIPPVLFQTYETAIKYGRSHISMSDDPIGILRSLVSSLSRYYIVLDALDESRDLDLILKDILGLAGDLPSVHFLCLSRDNASIRRSIEKLATIKLSADSNKADIDN